MKDQSIFRFAPSPNGELHLGHGFSALFSWREAKRAGGRFLLRIEDIDSTRARPEFTKQIYEDLDWLGLEWEQPVRQQSDHMDEYRQALDRLEARGLLYPCFASRGEIHAALERQYPRGDWPLDPEGQPVYPGLHKGLSADEISRRKAQGQSFALRLDMARALDAVDGTDTLGYAELGVGPQGDTGRLTPDPSAWGDVILGRKDIGTSYHIAVVVDDALQQISHVTRGQDLFYATHIHRLLQGLLGLTCPIYQHHRLIRDQEGRKLSKSLKDKSLRTLRAEGVSAQEIIIFLGF